MVTIFKNIFSKEPHLITVSQALARIKQGKSKSKVEEIRTCLDKERGNELKKNLPSICFSGEFKQDRRDEDLIKHSLYIVLDFDMVNDCVLKRTQLSKYSFVKAAWISPSGNGVKCLVKIKDGKNHKEHFKALQDLFPEVDKSGINISRVCYESYDPDIFIREDEVAFDKIKKEEVIEKKAVASSYDKFNNVLKWLSNRGDAFRTGERNLFLYKLASASCRFGIDEVDCENEFIASFGAGSDFTRGEVTRTIKSAYKANMSLFGSAVFQNEVLIDSKNKQEVVINEDIYNLEIKPKDVIFGEDVKAEALNIYHKGYESASTTYVKELDVHFKWKKGELTLLTGIGNYGKSSFLKYLLMLKMIVEGKKFAIFSPEDNPASEFYHDLTEIFFGQNMTPDVLYRPNQSEYEAVYDFISKHIFYVYPKTIAPTPEYIKERFLELIIKEKIEGCIIDPFNQMTNDYSSFGGRDDKYLETVLSDLSRFAQLNEVLFVIVAHPKAMRKDKDNPNYPEPDVFDLAGGAMWNNKMDNILVYHRPYHGEDKTSPICTLSAKKIRRQKIVGIPGTIEFELNKRARRFMFNGSDYIAEYVAEINKARGMKEESFEKGIENNTEFLNQF